MARIKITAYVTPDVADTLKRIAAIEDRSISDIMEDALVRRLADAGRDAEHAALMVMLDRIARRLGIIERGQHTHFELSAQTSRFLLSVAPEISAADRPTLNTRGADRFRNVMALVLSKLAAGEGTLQEAIEDRPAESKAGAAQLEPAE